MKETVAVINITRRTSLMLKGIAIILVLLGHTGYVPFGGGAGVGIFLMLSGYGLDKSLEKNGLAKFWGNRLEKVYLPYLMVAVFNIIIFGFNSWVQIPVTILGLDLSLNVDATMWFISFIFLWYFAIYVCFLLIQKVGNNKYNLLIKFFILLSMSAFCYILNRLHFWHNDADARVYIFLFPFGVLLSELSHLQIDKKWFYILWSSVFIICVIRIISLIPNIGTWLRLSMPLSVIALFHIFDFNNILGKCFEWFGKYSFSIYLFEGHLVLFDRNRIFSFLRFQTLIDIAAISLSIVLAFTFWKYIYLRLVQHTLKSENK